ncbi:MAG: hypothetical protein V1928_00065 [Parcubacteria group bacterium]
MDARTVLTCPHCRNSNPKQITVLFPRAIKYYKADAAVDEISARKAGPFAKRKNVLKMNGMVPNFFRCEKCCAAFRLNKHGLEYAPKVSPLICPGCGLGKFGAMKVASSGMKNCATTKKSYAKVKFYTENEGLDVNGFECPECGEHFFVDGNGKEI